MYEILPQTGAGLRLFFNNNSSRVLVRHSNIHIIPSQAKNVPCDAMKIERCARTRQVSKNVA